MKNYYDEEVIRLLNDYDYFRVKFSEDIKLGDKWFIVSNSWIQKWNKFHNQNDSIEKIGKINSGDIIDTNDFIVLNGNYTLLPEAKFNVDYKILPQLLWKHLRKNFGYDHKIARKVISVFSILEVEVKLTRLSFFILKNSQLISEVPYQFYFSLSALIQEVTSTLKSFTEKNKKSKEISSCRLWTVGSQRKASDIVSLLSEKSDLISFPGTRIESHSRPLLDLTPSLSNLFLFEYKEGYTTKFTLREKAKQKCFICQKQSNDGHESESLYFCSSECASVHSVSSETEANSQSKILKKRPGLKNIGSTCYLNAGLQCLFHTAPLYEFIVSQSYIKDLNQLNPLSTKGKLFDEFASLLLDFHLASQEVLIPTSLKSILGEFANQFLLFDQQDCQEMLCYLLDGLHEDVNRVTHKPLTSIPEDITGDKELMQTFWENYKNRNDSFFVDSMHGQFRSEIECPECSKVSKTFDPFSMVSLPIPSTDFKTIFFVLVTAEGSIMGKVEIDKTGSVQELRKEISKVLDLDAFSFEIAEFHEGRFKKFLKDSNGIKKKSTVLIYHKPKFEIDFLCQDIKYLVISFRKKANSNAYVNIGKPHLIPIQFYLTLKEVYFEVFQYTLNMRKIYVADVLAEYDKRMPSYLKKSYLDTDEFRLYTENPSIICPQCSDVKCTGCYIKPSDDLIMSLFMSCQEPFIRLSVLLSSKIKDTGPFEDLFFHPSCNIKPQNPRSSFTLSECFHLFSQKEQLDSENSIYCNRCFKHINGIKKMDIVRLPRILIIHLKRFKRKGRKSKKNSSFVKFPIEGLDTGEMCNVPGVYDLFSVVQHHGTLDSGHYTAICKDDDGFWRLYDDDFVSITNTVTSSSAYILFYQLIS